MIKKALLFILLVSIGFSGVYYATGGGEIARFGEDARLEARTGQDSTPRDRGVVIPQGDGSELGEHLKVTMTGSFELRQTRDVPLPDGGIRAVPVYELRAEKNEPLPDGRQELTGVTVVFYEADRTLGSQVVEAGTLRADRAEISVGLDERGQRSVATDKDVVLHNAVLTTTANGRIKNLRLELTQALVRATDRAISLRTATDDQEFSLRIREEQELSLTGRGLRARFPLAVADAGEPDPTDRISIQVSSAAELVHGSARGPATLRSDGPLSYIENPSSGLARVAARRRVSVTAQLPESGEASAASALTARGDRLEATLQRGRESSRQGSQPRARWRSILLTGAPATLEMADLEVDCESLHVAPNLSGTPWLVTASGNPRVAYEVDGETMRLQTSGRAHVVYVRERVRAWLRPMGIRGSDFPRQAHWLLTLNGRSTVALEREDAAFDLAAEEGLRILRDAQNLVTSVIGRGAVDITAQQAGEPTVITGSDGFLLQHGPQGQTLFLGPRQPDPAHRFTVRSRDLLCEGSGACRWFQPADPEAPGELTLDSPAADLSLSLKGREGRLRQVAQLTARFVGEAVDRFEARGAECLLDATADDQAISGAAEHIVGTAAWMRLSGWPARVVSSGSGMLEGHTVEITRLGGDAVALAAEGNAALCVTEAAGGDQLGQDVELTAERIAVLPFLAPPAAVGLQTSWAPVLLAGLQPLSRRHLFAWGQVHARLVEAGAPPSEASGETMVLWGDEGAAAAVLRGAPATFLRRDEGAQDIAGEAPVIRLARTEGRGEWVKLCRTADGLPSITMRHHEGSGSRLGAPGGSSRLECDGDLGLEPLMIVPDGPVTIVSLTAAGVIDPAGLQMQAGSMRARRAATDGQLTEIEAWGGAELDWGSIESAADRLHVDLLTETCRIVDANGTAWVQLPGVRIVCAIAEFNYRTYESAAWHTLITGEQSTR
ncbi:MAG: hypothetical protein AAF628_26310 [Planctomycetota bacterium]